MYWHVQIETTPCKPNNTKVSLFLIGTTHCHTCSLGLDFGIEYRMATYGFQKWLVTGYSMVLLVLPHVTGMFYWFLPQLAWLLPFGSFLGSMNQSGPPTQTAHGTQLSQIFLEHFKWQGVLCWHSCSTDDIANDFRPKRFVSRDRLIKTEHSKREYRRKDQQATSCWIWLNIY